MGERKSLGEDLPDDSNGDNGDADIPLYRDKIGRKTLTTKSRRFPVMDSMLAERPQYPHRAPSDDRCVYFMLGPPQPNRRNRHRSNVRNAKKQMGTSEIQRGYRFL